MSAEQERRLFASVLKADPAAAPEALGGGSKLRDAKAQKERITEISKDVKKETKALYDVAYTDTTGPAGDGPVINAVTAILERVDAVLADITKLLASSDYMHRDVAAELDALARTVTKLHHGLSHAYRQLTDEPLRVQVTERKEKVAAARDQLAALAAKAS